MILETNPNMPQKEWPKLNYSFNTDGVKVM